MHKAIITWLKIFIETYVNIVWQPYKVARSMQCLTYFYKT